MDSDFKFVLGSPSRGWLRRQGGMMRGWHRKYFVLQDNCLFCFHREDDTQVATTYLLDLYQLKDILPSADEPDKFPFELVSESGESVILCAASDAEKKEWMKALCYHIYAGRGGAMFGLPLAEAMKYEHKQGRSIPYIVQACVQHLERFALETEGIFRLAGRAGLLKELRGQFEMGQQPSLENVDVHTVASLLKAYLRDLPQSLIPPYAYQRIMNCALRHLESKTAESHKTEVECLSGLLEELPDINYATLAYICRFLHRLTANSDKTKMTAHNLSLVFGPNLIRHMDDSPELMMVTADLTQHLTLMMISNCPQVLPVRPERESVPVTTTTTNNNMDTDSPMLRKKNPLHSVVTADLLRMSEPVDMKDSSLLLPRPTALQDLVGLQLSPQQLDSGEKGQSPVTPPSPFVFVNDYFDETGDSASEKRDGTSSGEASGGPSEKSGRSTDRKPVPPKRTKSRTLRNRRSAGTPSSPLTPESPRQLDSQDILTALASASQDQEGSVQSSEEDTAVGGASQEYTAPDRPTVSAGAEREDGKGSRKYDVPDSSEATLNADETRNKATGSADREIDRGKGPSNGTHSQKHTFSTSVRIPVKDWNNSSSIRSYSPSQTLRTTTTQNTPDTLGSARRDADRIRPSPAILEAQVAALKSELISLRARSERMVAALKHQLTEMRTKYEARISSLEQRYKSQMVDLRAKLDAERSAREEAVERTVCLQAQLYKYKLQYGELQDAN